MTVCGDGKLNLYEKLVEVRKSVSYLKKKEKGYQFNYVSSSQAIMAVRGEMDKQGLLLIPEVRDAKITEHRTLKGNVEFLTELKVAYTWVNAEEPTQTHTMLWYGQGMDTGEKGVGKALTYAEKYFLLKQFNIATDNADPDLLVNKKIEVREKPATMPYEMIGLFNQKNIMKAKRDAMWTKALEMSKNDPKVASDLLKEQLEGAE